MIPYFYYPTITLGPFTLYVWGLFVAIGIITAASLALRQEKRNGLDPNIIVGWCLWIVLGAFVGARLFHVFFYNWPYYQTHLVDALKIWEGGLSSFGGFTGAIIVSLIYFRNKKIRLLAYADAIMYGFPLGWGIGRIGCFITHLHIGRLSNLPFAVAFPGGARLDMGLIEAAIMLTYGLIRLSRERKQKRPAGFYLAHTMIFYGVMRFILDFGRATDITMPDARYFGLTPAQYGSIALVFGGIYLVWHISSPVASSNQVDDASS